MRILLFVNPTLSWSLTILMFIAVHRYLDIWTKPDIKTPLYRCTVQWPEWSCCSWTRNHHSSHLGDTDHSLARQHTHQHLQLSGSFEPWDASHHTKQQKSYQSWSNRYWLTPHKIAWRSGQLKICPNRKKVVNSEIPHQLSDSTLLNALSFTVNLNE